MKPTLLIWLKIKLAKHRCRPLDKSNDWKSPQKTAEEAQERFNQNIVQTYKQWAPDKESENKEELDQKVSALKHAVEQAAETHLEKKPKKEQDHKRSEKLEALFKDRSAKKSKDMTMRSDWPIK